MDLIAHIPIKPVLKKFLYYKLDQDPEDPIDATNPHPVLSALQVLLAGKKRLSLRTDLDIGQRFTETVAVQINMRRFQRSEIFLSPQAVIKWNRFLYKYFLQDLLDFVVAKRSHGFKVKQALEDYIYLLDIEDDIAIETITKALQRLRQKKGITAEKLTKMSEVFTKSNYNYR